MSLFELAAINVLGFKKAPEILSEACLDIRVGKPAIAVLAPACPPGISNFNSAFVLADLPVVVISNGHNRMPTLDRIIRTRKFEFAFIIAEIIDREAKHGGIPGSQEFFQTSEQLG